MTATVVWLSLTPNPPPLPVPLLSWDKAQHALAYLSLMFWYRQAFRRHWRWPVFLLALGTVLECLQGLGETRTFDLRDIYANGIGVAIGLALASTRLGGILEKIDTLLALFFNKIRTKPGRRPTAN